MSLDLGTVSGKVDLDVGAFEKKYATVDAALSKLESAKSAEVRVDADVASAERNLTSVETFVSGVLDGMSAELNVAADTTTAERKLDAVETAAGVVDGMKSELLVQADTSAAEGALEDIADTAESAGEDGGSRMGDGMAAGILAGLASIPIAGAIVKIGQSIAGGLLQGIQDGFGQEVSRDLFSAKTGLDEDTARKFAIAAGSAYGQAWGESVEANLDTARQALTTGLIDADATSSEIEQIISKFEALGTIAEEESGAIARATSRMVDSGLAGSIDEAMDALTVGFQGGLNQAEDLLDTFTEYPSVLVGLGLSVEETMGLLSQGLDAGARDSDKIADALKELGLRVREGTDPAIAALDDLGLKATDVVDAFGEGGPRARDALGTVLDALRDMREEGGNTQEVITNLFGGPGEDLGAALFALDVGSAAGALGEFDGALQNVMDTLGDNTATKVEAARRSIETAADGIKGALASAFADPLEDFAGWVAGNQAGVLEVLGAIGSGMFDMAEAGVEGAATLIEAFASVPEAAFGPIVDALVDIVAKYQLMAEIIPGLPSLPADLISGLVETRDNIEGMADAGEATADRLRESLIGGVLDPLRAAYDEELEIQIDAARARDDAYALAEAVGSIGEGIENLNGVEFTVDGKFSAATEAGAGLDEAMRNAAGAMADLQGSSAAAGDSAAGLSEKFYAGRDAVVEMLTQMGYAPEKAAAIADAYGLIPDMIETSVELDSAPATATLNNLLVEVDSASGTVTVNGDETPAATTLGELVGNIDSSDGTVAINGNRLPADMTLATLLSIIGGSSETVTIDGNDYPAEQIRQGLLRNIRGSEASVNIGANTADAYRSVDQLLRTYEGRTMTVYTMVKTIGQAPVATGGDVDAHAAAASAATRLAGGGSVIGPGTGTSDDVPAAHPSGVQFWLSNGEHVLTADDVLDLGGQQGAYALRAMIQAGMVKPLSQGPGMASGGAVGGSSAAAAGLPAVYVQNPWTGEYLEARAVDIARHESQRALVGAARKGR